MNFGRAIGIIPSRIRAVSEFERSFSTRLGSTFEACAQIIAAQYHRQAQRGYKLHAFVSKSALEEVNIQIRAFESMATQAQRLRFDDMVAAVLSKASDEDAEELSLPPTSTSFAMMERNSSSR